MSFANKNDNLSMNKKQRLNLSKSAKEVLENDKFCFGAETDSGLINTIFQNYAPDADASVALRLNEFEDVLEERLGAMKGIDEGVKKRIITSLVSEKKDQLVDKIKKHSKGESLSFSLNDENWKYLMEKGECQEQKYYTRRGEYIKEVIEEYASLPYVQRERIYLKDTVGKIETAIEKKYQLKIETENGELFSVYPYMIMQNSLSTVNYLVCYKKRYDHTDDEKTPGSFRLLAVKNVRIEKSKSAFLNKGDREKLQKAVDAHGAQSQFMSSEVIDAEVRFTEYGLDMYKRVVFNRPMYSEKVNENTYRFSCSFSQAEYYFFKFGEDAEVLEPQSLRNKLSVMYQRAARVYSQKG